MSAVKALGEFQNNFLNKIFSPFHGKAEIASAKAAVGIFTDQVDSLEAYFNEYDLLDSESMAARAISDIKEVLRRLDDHFNTIKLVDQIEGRAYVAYFKALFEELQRYAKEFDAAG